MSNSKITSVLCIGAAHWDVRSQCKTPILKGTSNPVTVTRHPGGVAHNVAVNLSRLGNETGLVSYWGRDAAGDALQACLMAAGLTVLGLPRSELYPTATYTAVLDMDGELAFGLADMAVYDDFSPDHLTQIYHDLEGYPIWFMDTNMPSETLDVLADWHRVNRHNRGNRLLAADAVSVAKAHKLNSVIDRLDLLFCNRDEAAELTGSQVENSDDILRAGEALIERGAGAVVISAGEEGAYLFEKGKHSFFPAHSVEVVDVTGAGDSLIAGTLHGISMGHSNYRALELGIKIASLTLKEQGATSEALRDTKFIVKGSPK